MEKAKISPIYDEDVLFEQYNPKNYLTYEKFGQNSLFNYEKKIQPQIIKQSNGWLGTTYYVGFNITFPIIRKIKGKEIGEPIGYEDQLWILTSDWNFYRVQTGDSFFVPFFLDTSELNCNSGFLFDIVENMDLKNAVKCFDIHTIKKILNEKELSDKKEILNKLINFYKQNFFWIADAEDYSIFHAIFDVASYYTSCFDVVPFLWLTGGKGSGKTTLGFCHADLMFKCPKISSASSLASTWAFLNACGGNCCIDEVGKLADAKLREEKELRDMLITSNNKNSLFLKMQLKEKNWSVKFSDLFGFKIFSADSLPIDLITRSFVCEMHQKPDDFFSEINFPKSQQLKYELRHHILIHSIVTQSKLCEIYREFQESERELTNRLGDKSIPLLSVAFLWGGEKIFLQLKKFLLKLYSENEVKAIVNRVDLWTSAVVFGLAQLLGSAEEESFTTSQIFEIAKTYSEWEGEIHQKFNTMKVGKIMKKLNFDKKNFREAKGWFVKKNKLESVMRNLRLSFSQIENGKVKIIEDDLSGNNDSDFIRSLIEQNGEGNPKMIHYEFLVELLRRNDWRDEKIEGVIEQMKKEGIIYEPKPAIIGVLK